MTDKPPIVTGIGDEKLLEALRAEHFTIPSDQSHIIVSVRVMNACRAIAGLPPCSFCDDCHADPCRCSPPKPVQALLCPAGCGVELICREGRAGNHCPRCMGSFSVEHVAIAAYERGRADQWNRRALHVWHFEVTRDWFVAGDEEEALNWWKDQHDPEDYEDTEIKALLVPDHELFEKSDDGGDSVEVKTCQEWAKENGPGWFAGEI